MGEREPAVRNRRFGQYLRRIREDRRLSLDAVEELTLGYPGRVTKSHLSRIENGQAEPTFPRMFALSQIYGVPISMLAERFEIDLMRRRVPEDCAGLGVDEIRERARALLRGGRNDEALVLFEHLLDRPDLEPADVIRMRIERLDVLVQLGRIQLAKEECESLLSFPDLTAERRGTLLYYHATCCVRLGRLQMAAIVAERAEQAVRAAHGSGPSLLGASIHNLSGNIAVATGDAELALGAYERAAAVFEACGNRFEACRSRVNHGFALVSCGRALEARGRLRSLVTEAEASGWDRLLALALSHLGVLAVRGDDADGAEAHLIRSNGIARPQEYTSLVFRNCYYLRRIAQSRGDDVAARSFERSLRSTMTRVDPTLEELTAYQAEINGGDA